MFVFYYNIEIVYKWFWWDFKICRNQKYYLPKLKVIFFRIEATLLYILMSVRPYVCLSVRFFLWGNVIFSALIKIEVWFLRASLIMDVVILVSFQKTQVSILMHLISKTKFPIELYQQKKTFYKVSFFFYRFLYFFNKSLF